MLWNSVKPRLFTFSIAVLYDMVRICQISGHISCHLKKPNYICNTQTIAGIWYINITQLLYSARAIDMHLTYSWNHHTANQMACIVSVSSSSYTVPYVVLKIMRMTLTLLTCWGVGTQYTLTFHDPRTAFAYFFHFTTMNIEVQSIASHYYIKCIPYI